MNLQHKKRSSAGSEIAIAERAAGRDWPEPASSVFGRSIHPQVSRMGVFAEGGEVEFAGWWPDGVRAVRIQMDAVQRCVAAQRAWLTPAASPSAPAQVVPMW